MKLLIFTYAPAGLGHLRVTDALVDGLPEKSTYLLLGSVDSFITWAHRFTSINPIGKYIFLQSQYGIAEAIFTAIYRKFLILTAGSLYKQLKDIIARNPSCDEVCVISTHFGMAHQIGAIKEKLRKETGHTVHLMVQVTDDTSQRMWCVEGANLTFVPSYYVKRKLENYAKQRGIEFNCEVIPYPLSGTLIKKLTNKLGDRHETFSNHAGVIRIAIPISGAAVGLGFVTMLVKLLNALSKRFEFWILVKKSPFTDMFVSTISAMDRVNVLVGKNDNEMIAMYEKMYEQNLIHLEITKPSEQAFKAILSPDRIGGSLLLFTSPVGRQEYENMEFLRRHGLLSSSGYVAYPRAISLPENAEEAAKRIMWAVESGLFARMTASNFRFSKQAMESGEIGGDGGRLFWKKAARYFGHEK